MDWCSLVAVRGILFACHAIKVCMKKGILHLLIASCCLIVTGNFTGCAESSSAGGTGQDTATTGNTGRNDDPKAIATITGTYPDTTVNGTARFEQDDDGEVEMKLQLNIPAKANQTVAVHIHEHGNCGDTAHQAGGHWNPTNAQHGRWGSASFHSGDIGNVTLDASGNGYLEMETTLWSIGGSPQTDILNKTIIVHGGMDDYTSQPTGNSGNRIGCGVIQRTRDM